MNTTAYIGSYSSPRMIVTGFDVQRTNERVIQNTPGRKLIGKSRQNIRLSLSGYINCSTFSELEEEVDTLVEALNSGEIQVWLGAQPDRFYAVSWSGAALERRPSSGGPTLPFSLDFDVLEEGAVKGLPCSYAAVGVPGAPLMASSLGRPADDVLLTLPGAFFASVPTAGYSGWVIRDLETDSGLQLSRAGDTVTVSLIKDGVSLASWNAPSYETVTLGLVLDKTKTIVYISGIPHTFKRGLKFYSWLLQVNTALHMYAAFDFVPSNEFMRMVHKSKASDFINVFKIDGSSFLYSGANNTPASVFVVARQVYGETLMRITTAGNAVSCNDFGAGIESSFGGWFNFNGITGEVEAEYLSEINNISYEGITLIPRLKQGMNTPRIRGGIEEAYIFWRERIR